MRLYKTRMMYQVSRTTLDRISPERWDEFVDSAGGSFYHRSCWLRSLCQALDHEPVHFTVEKNGSIVGVWPNFVTQIPRLGFARLHSLPSGHGGPVIGTDREEVLTQFLDSIYQYGTERGFASHLVTPNTRGTEYLSMVRAAGYTVDINRCGIELALPDSYDRVLQYLSKDRRYEFRKAREGPLEARLMPLSAGVDSFYPVYELAMERNNTAPNPKELFEELGERCGDSAQLWLAYADSEPVAGIVNLVDERGDTVHNHFAGANAEYFSDSPMELLHANAIEWTIENGMLTYDFGSTRPDFREGLFGYKEQYSNRIVPYVNWERGLSRFKHTAYKLGRVVDDRFDL